MQYILFKVKITRTVEMNLQTMELEGGGAVDMAFVSRPFDCQMWLLNRQERLEISYFRQC